MIKFMETFNKIWMTAATILLIIAGLCNFATKANAQDIHQFEEATHVKSFSFVPMFKLTIGGVILIDDQPVICMAVDRNIIGDDKCVINITPKEWIKYKKPEAQYIGFRVTRSHTSKVLDVYYIGE